MSEQIGGLESIDAMDESEGLNHGMTKRQFLTALGTATAAVAALGPAETVVSAPATIKSASIDYWTFFNPKDDNARSKAQNMMLESFKKKYPNIYVNITVYPWQRIDQQLVFA